MRVVTLLALGMVLGLGRGAWPLLRRIFSLRLGPASGMGGSGYSWIHLDDEVGLILDAT